MPGTSGAALVKMLWDIKPATPIIVLSGASEAEQEYEGLAVTFREKPIAPLELIELVKTVLGNGNKAA
jgi:FixJ family two-component response regulator